MRYLRQLCAAFALTLILAMSAFAGQMSTTVTPPPPPPSSTSTATGERTTGDTGEISTTSSVTDSATQITLNLVQGMLSLF